MVVATGVGAGVGEGRLVGVALAAADDCDGEPVGASDGG
jgi:hypothetical protein